MGLRMAVAVGNLLHKDILNVNIHSIMEIILSLLEGGTTIIEGR